MIAVPMSCIDSCEIFSHRGNPIGLTPGLFQSDKGIDQHGVSQTEDESRRDRRPRALVFTGRNVWCHDGNTWRYEHIPLQMSIRDFLAAISKVRCWHVVSSEYSLGKARCQKAACDARKKTPRSARSVFSHKNTGLD